MSDQLTFLFNIEYCTGCMACVVACQDQNDLKAGNVNFRTVESFEKGPYPAIVGCFSIACMHCGDAPCLMACPTGALSRHEENGVVDINRDLCIGCKSCALACPFGAPKFTEDGKMAKCDLCYVRVAHGLKPACVHTCTTGALQYGSLEELTKIKSRDAAMRILKSSGLSEK